MCRGLWTFNRVVSRMMRWSSELNWSSIERGTWVKLLHNRMKPVLYQLISFASAHLLKLTPAVYTLAQVVAEILYCAHCAQRPHNILLISIISAVKLVHAYYKIMRILGIMPARSDYWTKHTNRWGALIMLSAWAIVHNTYGEEHKSAVKDAQDIAILNKAASCLCANSDGRVSPTLAKERHRSSRR